MHKSSRDSYSSVCSIIIIQSYEVNFLQNHISGKNINIKIKVLINCANIWYTSDNTMKPIIVDYCTLQYLRLK